MLRTAHLSNGPHYQHQWSGWEVLQLQAANRTRALYQRLKDTRSLAICAMCNL
jgi:hypothetical protein